MVTSPHKPVGAPIHWKRVGIASVIAGAALLIVITAAMPDDGTLAEARVQKIIRLYGGGQLAEAESAFEAATLVAPKDHRVWLAGGMLAEHSSNVSLATARYTQARGLMGADNASRIEVDITLCDLIRRSGDASGALHALDQVAKDASQTRIPGRWRHARALVLIDLRRFEEALSETRLLAEEEGGRGISRGLEAQIQREFAHVQVGGGHQAAASTPR